MIYHCRIWIIVILSLISSNLEEYHCLQLAENDNFDSGSARVFITVSSLLRLNKITNQTTERNIELNWNILDYELLNNTDIWVGLYTEEPNSNATPIVKVHINGKEEGSFTTNVTYPRYVLNITEGNDYCMGYWVALVKSNDVLVKNCYLARPNWMHEMKYTIGFNSLRDLMIPGTHNSGSYSRENRSQETYKTASVMCQDEDIWNQLMYGIRFLDLRVSYRIVSGSSEVFWISHSIFRMDLTVKEVLKTVKKFLASTKEIIIMDFHLFHFTFNEKPETYRKLMKIIENEVGEYMIPRNYGYEITLNELWKRDKRLLVGFNSIQAYESILFYPAISHLWANVDHAKGLEIYLEKNVCQQNRKILWSAMAELTPNWLTHFMKFEGLRRMAQDVNLLITRMFRNNFWNCANIVATDFFLGNDIISVSIESNKRRFDE